MIVLPCVKHVIVVAQKSEKSTGLENLAVAGTVKTDEWRRIVMLPEPDFPQRENAAATACDL